jgi:hypothetical protein
VRWLWKGRARAQGDDLHLLSWVLIPEASLVRGVELV